MVAQSYLKQNMSSHHGICVPQMRGVDKKVEVPATYVVSFSRVIKLVRFMVPGLPVVCHSAGRLR